jgi:hypothetical protein
VVGEDELVVQRRPFVASAAGRSGSRPLGYPMAGVPSFVVLGLIGIAIVSPLSYVGDTDVAVQWLATMAVIAAAIVTFGGGRPQAFSADTDGITLGVTRGPQWRRQRTTLTLPWSAISSIRVVRGNGRASADVLIYPHTGFGAAAVRSRTTDAREIALACVPGSFLFRKPAMLLPLAEPVRYRIRLRDVSVEETSSALVQLAPTSVLVADAQVPLDDDPALIADAPVPSPDALPPGADALPPLADTSAPIADALPPVSDALPPVADALPPVAEPPVLADLAAERLPDPADEFLPLVEDVLPAEMDDAESSAAQ